MTIREYAVQVAGMRRAAAIALLVLGIVLSAGVLPACMPGLCCPVTTPVAATIHAQMPCCAETNSSIAPPDLSPAQTATITGSAKIATSTAVVARVAPVQASPERSRVSVVAAARHEHSPPLFLRNAQLLI